MKHSHLKLKELILVGFIILTIELWGFMADSYMHTSYSVISNTKLYVSFDGLEDPGDYYLHIYSSGEYFDIPLTIYPNPSINNVYPNVAFLGQNLNFEIQGNNSTIFDSNESLYFTNGNDTIFIDNVNAPVPLESSLNLDISIPDSISLGMYDLYVYQSSINSHVLFEMHYQ